MEAKLSKFKVRQIGVLGSWVRLPPPPPIKETTLRDFLGRSEIGDVVDKLYLLISLRCLVERDSGYNNSKTRSKVQGARKVVEVVETVEAVDSKQ